MKSKILVVSDSHGNHVKLRAIIERESPFECIIHCGDGVFDLYHAPVPKGAVSIGVAGNVDLYRMPDYQREAVREINGKVLYVTHGDIFGVQHGLEKILAAGRDNGAHVILFGHTHLQYVSSKRPVLFNPGAASNGQYGVLYIGDKIEAEHRTVFSQGFAET